MPDSQVAEAHIASLEEYNAATQAVGIVDRSGIGRVKISGSDGLDLLNRLTTNKLDDLTQGRMEGTVLTTNKGRIIDLLFVLRQDDHLLMLTSPGNTETVIEAIDFYIFADDVEMSDVSEQTSIIGVIGPNAAACLSDVTGGDVISLEKFESIQVTLGESQCTLVRTDFACIAGYDIVMDAANVDTVREALMTGGASHEIKAIRPEAFEVVRVQQGIPAYGQDMGEKNNPHEANLIGFVSFNKDCYVGQEVVARLNAYDKVQRYLVGLSWGDSDNPSVGDDIVVDGKKVGDVTSVVTLPDSGRGIGLGYVRRAHCEPGTSANVTSDGGQINARVEALPIEL